MRALHPWPRRVLRTAQFGATRLWNRHGLVNAKAAPFGLTFRGPINDCITRHIYRLGSHEPMITQYLLDHIRLSDIDIALDIGANLGWYSVILDRLSTEGARVFAFEPDPSTYALLERNLTANRTSRVTALNLALGDKPGVAQLHRYKDSNNGRHTLMTGGNTSGGTVQVDVDTLAHFWQANELGKRRIRFMKIDVEGFEYFVLRGAGDEILSRCECVLLEYSPGSLRDVGMSTDALLSMLQLLFRAYAFENGKLVRQSFRELAAAEVGRDLILLPATSLAQR